MTPPSPLPTPTRALSTGAPAAIAFALDAVRPRSDKGAFAYVVIPAAGWLFVATGTLLAAAIARRGAG